MMIISNNKMSIGSLRSGHHQRWRRYRLCPIYAHSSAPRQLQTGFLLWLSENSRLIATAGLSLLMSFGLISIVSNVQDILQMRTRLEAS